MVNVFGDRGASSDGQSGPRGPRGVKGDPGKSGMMTCADGYRI